MQGVERDAARHAKKTTPHHEAVLFFRGLVEPSVALQGDLAHNAGMDQLVVISLFPARLYHCMLLLGQQLLVLSSWRLCVCALKSIVEPHACVGPGIALVAVCNESPFLVKVCSGEADLDLGLVRVGMSPQLPRQQVKFFPGEGEVAAHLDPRRKTGIIRRHGVMCAVAWSDVRGVWCFGRLYSGADCE